MPAPLYPSALKPLGSTKAATATAVQARPMATPPSYHSLLTPRLHKRFLRTVTLTIATCYVVSIFFSNASNWFWTIFPLSWTGFKAGYLFLATIPLLGIFLQYQHVSAQISPSPVHTVFKALGHIRTWIIFFGYYATVGLMVQLYLLSRDSSRDLGLIIEGRSYERPRLNERYIYMSFLAFYIAAAQTALHFYEDRNRLVLASPSFNGKIDIPTPATTKFGRYFQNLEITKFLEMVTARGKAILTFSLLTTTTGPFVYVFFRGKIWRFMHAITRSYYPISRSNHLPSWPIYFGLCIHAAFITSLVCACIEGCHAAFTLQFTLPPIRDGKPMSERSKDPNGTLINGLLKEKREYSRAMAFWELALITQYFPVRRKSIFMDIDRQPQAWISVKQACLAVLSETVTTITNLNKPPPPPPAAAPVSKPKPDPENAPPAIPIKEENIFLSSPNSNRIRHYAEKFIHEDSNVTLASKTLEAVPVTIPKRTDLVDYFRDQVKPLLTSPVGWVLQRTVQRKTSQLIPNVGLQVNAIVSLAKLAVTSVEEDEYGLVQRDLPEIFEAFLSALDVFTNYIEAFPVDWTDIEAEANRAGVRLEEPIKLVETLRDCLNEMTTKFEPYLNEIKASPATKKRLTKMIKEGQDKRIF